MKANEFKPGDRVMYCPNHGETEYGRVVTSGETYVFVWFTDQHPNANAKACHPQNLVKLLGNPPNPMSGHNVDWAIFALFAVVLYFVIFHE